MSLFILQHTEVIEEKIKNAPDSGYQIGVVIGSFIPFLVLIILAYWLYYRAKKREKES
jgi:hypothetical protein